ncbi:MAG TPA: choice-of-anchor D domain-containing protein, partial [Candidatus Eisenbacteria bacterium]|nr:choice-of-anchor D domain-containing protein [Candidatus Eisenbacteria bacterium]
MDIRNRGTDRLEVTSMTASPGEMTVVPASLSIAPGEMATVEVTFTPGVAGPVTGDLSIQSNDPDSPELHVALLAVAADLPDITLSPPGGFTENLFTGGTVSRTLNVGNQGPGELSFEIKFATTGLEGSAPAVPDILFTPTAAPVVVSHITPKAAGETGRYDAGATPLRGDPTEADSRVASVTAQTAKVLIIHGGGYVYEIKTRLDAFPDITQVDELDLYSAPAPSLQTLLAYSCVLVSGNYPMMDPIGVGNVLADYVDQGGGVVMTVPSYITQYRLGGRFWTQGYSPFSEGSGPYSGSSLGTFNATHPIMAQVHALFADLLGHQSVSPGSEWVANFTDGTPLCATRGLRVAAVNVFVGSSGYWTGDVPLLLHNAIMWTMGSWVAPTPLSGRVPSGASMAVSLLFDAARLGGGSYQGNLEVRSNDPDESLLTLPLRLNVTAAPDIQAAPDSISFDPLFVGLSATQSLVLTNSGGVTLFVNDIQSSNLSWSSTTTSLILAPGETRNVPVTFHPQLIGALTGALHITSNDPDEPVISIVLDGQGLPAPDLEVNLDPIEAESEAGGQVTRTLHLGNSGGSVLTFFARGVERTDGTFSPRIELAPSGMSQTVV